MPVPALHGLEKALSLRPRTQRNFGCLYKEMLLVPPPAKLDRIWFKEALPSPVRAAG